MNTTNADASVFDLLIRDESPSGECKLCERHADTIKELREALEKIAAKGKYDEPTMNAGGMQQLARAILEKTK